MSSRLAPQELDLRQCPSLEALPSAISALTALHSLAVEMPGQQQLHLAQLGRLESLDIHCEGAHPPMASAQGLTSLRTLLLNGCLKMQAVPGEVWALERLQQLELSGCPVSHP